MCRYFLESLKNEIPRIHLSFLLSFPLNIQLKKKKKSILEIIIILQFAGRTPVLFTPKKIQNMIRQKSDEKKKKIRKDLNSLAQDCILSCTVHLGSDLKLTEVNRKTLYIKRALDLPLSLYLHLSLSLQFTGEFPPLQVDS